MQTIYLDISNKGVIPCIQAKQSEVGRKFLAVITDNGVPYNIPDTSLLSVWYDGDTDAGNYSSIEGKSAFSIEGNKISVELVAQMLLKPGNGELCLSITHGDGGETNTWNIPYCVEYKPGVGSAVPTEYYTALTEAGSIAAEQVGLAKQEAKNATEQANLAKQEADRAANLAKILIPVGYVFHWDPVENSAIDLSTPERVAEHFGFGSWEQIKDRFLLSTGYNHVAGETGGSETHTMTIAEMPRHTHSPAANVDVNQPLSGGKNAPGSMANSSYVQYNTGAADQTMFTTGATGGGEAFYIMPPYRTVYMWKRIA